MAESASIVCIRPSGSATGKTTNRRIFVAWRKQETDKILICGRVIVGICCNNEHLPIKPYRLSFKKQRASTVFVE